MVKKNFLKEEEKLRLKYLIVPTCIDNLFCSCALCALCFLLWWILTPAEVWLDLFVTVASKMRIYFQHYVNLVRLAVNSLLSLSLFALNYETRVRFRLGPINKPNFSKLVWVWMLWVTVILIYGNSLVWDQDVTSDL